jgi:hypothetical protein
MKANLEAEDEEKMKTEIFFYVLGELCVNVVRAVTKEFEKI